MAKGADVNAKDEDGDTPLDMAIGLEQPETVDLLRKHGGKTGEELKAERACCNTMIQLKNLIHCCRLHP